jgi:hypothetical protein
MLTTSKTIAESFSANIAELSKVRTDWSESFASGLKTRIDEAIQNYLGIDPKKSLRDATAVMSSIQTPARRDLSFLKTQIDDDFKDDPAKHDEIMKTLGFARHIREVQTGNQQSLVQLLYTFKTNMTDSLKQEISAKGVNVSLIDSIIGYADSFKEANINQETFKESTKEITKEAADVFNNIYDEIIGICKKASSYYQYESLKKEQFTFVKVITNLGAAKKAAVKIEALA